MTVAAETMAGEVVGLGVLPAPPDGEGGRSASLEGEGGRSASPGGGTDRRLADLLSAMTVEEKARLTYSVARPAGAPPAVGYVRGVERLGVAPMLFTDGPCGLVSAPRATALPVPVSLAASFDPRLAQEYGELLGTEAAHGGYHVLYTPMVNLVRVPQAGRNFESFGEDPHLTSRIAVAQIRGLQGKGVAAQVKHFVCNDHESNRWSDSSEVSERTLRELYLRPFCAALAEADSWSLMVGNNLVNGIYVAEHRALLHGVLRDELGWDGVIGSDYDATTSATGCVDGGLDQAFAARYKTEWYASLPELVRRGLVDEDTVTEHARRVLKLHARTGSLGGTRVAPRVDWAAHARFARRAGAAGIVLLKNDAHLLPLSPDSGSTIAVIGPTEYAVDGKSQGGGSSAVKTAPSVGPLAALRSRTAEGSVVYVPTGCTHEASCTCQERPENGEPDQDDLDRAVAAARACDVVIVVVGYHTREGRDRPGIRLPAGQDALISAVAAANPRTVVALHTGCAVQMPWISEVPAVLQAWYPGQEGGNALVDVLFGAVNPSAKLPVTFPVTLDQGPCHSGGRYPAEGHRITYSEGLEMGYRWYDSRGLRPLFPFGFGLSYTTFAVGNLRLSRQHIADPGDPRPYVQSQVTEATVDITNTGERDGAEVVQLYVSYPDGSGEPPRQLRAFQRVEVSAGETRTATMVLGADAFAVWNEDAAGWEIAEGVYTLHVGTSSRDLPLTADVRVERGRRERTVRLLAPRVVERDSTFVATADVGNSDWVEDTAIVSPRLPPGWTVEGDIGPGKVPSAAGRSTMSRWRIRVPGDARPGVHHLSVTAEFSGRPDRRAIRAASVQVPYRSLPEAYNQRAISQAGEASGLADVYRGWSFSREALAVAGLEPGRTITHAGLSFVWPDAGTDGLDNVAGHGQVIRLGRRCARLGILLVGGRAADTHAGTFVVTYADGSSDRHDVSIAGWHASQPQPGQQVVATADFFHARGGLEKIRGKTHVYSVVLSLRADVPAQYVTLPSSSRFHIFALAAGE